MILYHMSTTLRLGDALEPDHERNAELCQPFLQALELGGDYFTGMKSLPPVSPTSRG